jgi:hypothetical protein
MCSASRHRSFADVIWLDQKADERRGALHYHVTKLTAAERELDAAVAEISQHQ